MVTDANRRRGAATRILILLLAAAALLLVLFAPNRRATELPVIGQVPDFALTDQQGRPFVASALEGRPWIVAFLYTTCPGPCPLLLARAKGVQSRLGDGSDVGMLVVSVDPANDTPAVLAEYSQAHGLDPDAWTLVTGEVEDIVSLVREGFLLAIGPAAEMLADGTSPEELREIIATQGPVVHSTRLVLVDRQRRIRGTYESADTDAVDRLLADAASLVD